LKQVAIFDLDPQRANQFKNICEELFEEIVVVDEPRAIFKNNSLIVFATTAVKPHVADLSECAPGTIVLHTSLRDLTAEVILSSDNVVDDVDHVCRAQTSVHLAEQLVGHRDFIRCTLADVLHGTAAPKSDPSRVTVFSPFGLGVLDLAVGKLAFDFAVERGFGTLIESFLPASYGHKEAQKATN
jgi:ornithine cyclodeaminase